MVVRVATGADEAATLTNVAGAVASQSGIYALETADAVVGYTPRILIAPGWTSQRPGGAANPVGAAMVAIAPKMRAVAVVDGPGTNETDALAYAGDYGSDRVYIVDPGVLVFEDGATAARPASAYAAGVIAFRDNQRGFWWSPSNAILGGVVGASRPVPFTLNEPDTEANRLNEAKVATVVHQDGYRLWGNRTTATDPLWAFLSVRRTADMIYESVEQSLLWAIDRPITAQTIEDVADSVQGYINQLIARGALIGGRVWIDPEKNTAVTLQAGQLYLTFDIEPPAPLERLTFEAQRNGSYYEELVADLAET
ncbi:MAG: phage tail sheath subtilisin-like domain-containing protein [Pseudomonadota bacterium]